MQLFNEGLAQVGVDGEEDEEEAGHESGSGDHRRRRKVVAEGAGSGMKDADMLRVLRAEGFVVGAAWLAKTRNEMGLTRRGRGDWAYWAEEQDRLRREDEVGAGGGEIELSEQDAMEEQDSERR